MASRELIESWARSEQLLREARAALPADAALTFHEDLQQFEEFLDHNELGLALDCLRSITEEANYTVAALTQALSAAAVNMGRR